jgi:sec-independent protein translocase protein TatB
MFDISWTEFLLIGIVALIVIGPKELPGVMRTLGQWTRKVRSMANDFQNQFHEAMREAEMADLKKEVDDMAQNFSGFDPLKDVKTDFDSMGKDFEKSLDSPAAPKTEEPATAETNAAAPAEPALTDVPGENAPAAALPAPEAAAPPEPVAAAREPASTERSG